MKTEKNGKSAEKFTKIIKFQKTVFCYQPNKIKKTQKFHFKPLNFDVVYYKPERILDSNTVKDVKAIELSNNRFNMFILLEHTLLKFFYNFYKIFLAFSAVSLPRFSHNLFTGFKKITAFFLGL